MYKKIIALSLGITLAVSSFPLAVFAEDVQGDGSVASVADSQDDEQPVGEDAVDVDVAECDFADPDSFAESGICGDNASWSYDDTEGCLTISGSGDIYDYQNPDEDGSFIAPWFDLCDCILSIVIDDGITYIGDYAFTCMDGNSYINFEGTKEEWEAIGKAERWYAPYLGAGDQTVIVKCSDGTLTFEYKMP